MLEEYEDISAADAEALCARVVEARERSSDSVRETLGPPPSVLFKGK